MKEAGPTREILAFVDASKLESKLNVWGERDRVLAAGRAEFANETPQEATLDVDARQGSKGPGKNFHGYMRHDAVDMQSGLIDRVAATSGEVTDAAGLAYVCPSGGAVYADKGDRGRDAIDTLEASGRHDATIEHDNMKIEDRDKDGRISRMRSPYERAFSKTPNRMRCPGLDKAQFQVGAFAFARNLKRMVALGVKPISDSLNGRGGRSLSGIRRKRRKRAKIRRISRKFDRIFKFWLGIRFSASTFRVFRQPHITKVEPRHNGQARIVHHFAGTLNEHGRITGCPDSHPKRERDTLRRLLNATL